MGIVISPDSELGKELRRWDTPRNRPIEDANGDPMRDISGALIMGMGAVGYEEYPKMLYKAQIHNGKPFVSMAAPHPMHYTDPKEFERQSLWADGFTRSCQRTVRSEQEERAARNQGWCLTQGEALDLYDKEQQSFAQIAAEAAHTAQRMSEKARAEFKSAGDETHEHVTDVVGASKKTRGRPRKVKPVTGSGVQE